MTLAWKIMLPLGVINFVAVACVTELLHGWKVGLTATLTEVAIGWTVAILAWICVAMIAPMVTDNRPMLSTEKYAIASQMPPTE
jgi:NADH:ubiquinone oxidoreductase subunit H